MAQEIGMQVYSVQQALFFRPAFHAVRPVVSRGINSRERSGHSQDLCVSTFGYVPNTPEAEVTQIAVQAQNLIRGITSMSTILLYM